MATFTVLKKPQGYSLKESAEIKVPTAGSFVSKNVYCVAVEEVVTDYDGVQVHTFELELAKLDLACIKTLAASTGFEKVPAPFEAPSFFANVLAPIFKGLPTFFQTEYLIESPEYVLNALKFVDCYYTFLELEGGGTVTAPVPIKKEQLDLSLLLSNSKYDNFTKYIQHQDTSLKALKVPNIIAGDIQSCTFCSMGIKGTIDITNNFKFKIPVKEDTILGVVAVTQQILKSLVKEHEPKFSDSKVDFDPPEVGDEIPENHFGEEEGTLEDVGSLEDMEDPTPEDFGSEDSEDSENVEEDL